MWVPNWSSTAVACGIIGTGRRARSSAVAVQLRYLIFRQVMTWLTLLRAAHI
jgi:hypothetical protein